MATELVNSSRHLLPPPKIHAYCHIKTRQVLYARSTFLRPRALKQLPDIGANHTPPTLRKDLWLPLWSLIFPQDRPGQRYYEHQSADAFEKLLEWRTLHERNWKPPLALSRPFTEKEIEKMQDKLDYRGGSKVENVHDIIKRQKKKLRVHEVMNQKANSIADLAAILLEQDRKGLPSQVEAVEHREQNRRERDAQEILRLEQERRETNRLATRKQQASRLLKRMRSLGKSADDQKRLIQLGDQFLEAEMTVRKIEWSSQAIKAAKEGAVAAWKAGPAGVEARKQAEEAWMSKTFQEAEEAWKVRVARRESEARKKAVNTWKYRALRAALKKAREEKPGDITPHLRLRDAPEPPEDLDISRWLRPEGVEDLDSRPLMPEGPPEGLDLSPEPPSELDLRPFLPPFPEEVIYPSREGENSVPAEVPKICINRYFERLRKDPQNEEKYTVDGLCVYWSNPLDAEFAALWPHQVEHFPMLKSFRRAYGPEYRRQGIADTITEHGEELAEKRAEAQRESELDGDEQLSKEENNQIVDESLEDQPDEDSSEDRELDTAKELETWEAERAVAIEQQKQEEQERQATLLDIQRRAMEQMREDRRKAKGEAKPQAATILPPADRKPPSVNA